MLRIVSPDLVRSGFVRTPDGVHLYWRAVGHGPVIACCNGVGVSTFFWKYLVQHLRDRYTLVMWDYRGHGHSDRNVRAGECDLSIARHAEDLMLVLDTAAPGQPAVLAGHSMGCQVVLEAWSRYPRRVRGLLLLQGTAGHVLDTFFSNPRSPAVVGKLREMARAAGRLSNLLVRPLLASPMSEVFALFTNQMDKRWTAREDLENYLKHLASMDQRVFLECVLEAQHHSAWSLLPSIDIPTLIVGAERDTFTPLACSQRMAAEIPGAEFFFLPECTHAGLIEQPAAINRRLDQFLAEHIERAARSDPPELRSAS